MFASAIRAARQGFLGGSPLVITEGAELCTSAAAPLVLVRFNHVASGIVNANRGMISPAEKLGLADCFCTVCPARPTCRCSSLWRESIADRKSAEFGSDIS